MKPTNDRSRIAGMGATLKQACVGSCQKVLAQVARVKAAIFAEARTALNTQQHLLRLALNEAEAQAWQTEYPHLVFPALAMEKVQAVTAWSRRQQYVRHATAFRGAEGAGIF